MKTSYPALWASKIAEEQAMHFSSDFMTEIHYANCCGIDQSQGFEDIREDIRNEERQFKNAELSINQFF